MGGFSGADTLYELNMEDSQFYNPAPLGTKEMLELNARAGMELNFRGTNILSNISGACMNITSTATTQDLNIIGSVYTNKDVVLAGSLTGYNVNIGNFIVDEKVSINY